MEIRTVVKWFTLWFTEKETVSVAGFEEGFIKEQDHWILMDMWDLIEEERIEGLSITGSHLS